MAEKGGFEPPIGFSQYTISNRAPSTTRTFLQTTLGFTQGNVAEKLHLATRLQRMGGVSITTILYAIYHNNIFLGSQGGFS